ncbi:hypothetical protein E2542_SST23574 [Spatholobus suberectus]|nr:hypothetical protein E2542_SST23574 [Spatholobus suberectus]
MIIDDNPIKGGIPQFIRKLRKLKSVILSDYSNERTASQQENEVEGSDDGLPPLEVNTNRMRRFELQANEDSESSSDTDD